MRRESRASSLELTAQELFWATVFGAGEEQLSALLAELKSWGTELESIILSRAAVAEQVCLPYQLTLPFTLTLCCPPMQGHFESVCTQVLAAGFQWSAKRLGSTVPCTEVRDHRLGFICCPVQGGVWCRRRLRQVRSQDSCAGACKLLSKAQGQAATLPCELSGMRRSRGRPEDLTGTWH